MNQGWKQLPVHHVIGVAVTGTHVWSFADTSRSPSAAPCTWTEPSGKTAETEKQAWLQSLTHEVSSLSSFIVLKKTFSTTSCHLVQLLLTDDVCRSVTQHASLSLSEQTYSSPSFSPSGSRTPSPPIWQTNTAFVMATQISRPLQRRRLTEREDWGMKRSPRILRPAG